MPPNLLNSDRETSFIENTTLPAFSERERQGLDLALQRARGELDNNLGKLRELDEHIAREKEKLAASQDDPTLAENVLRLEAKLRDLELERAARLEAVSANREALRTQFNRICETFERLLEKDKTLGEKIRTLFLEQGITIASILTAVGMAISTLVAALTGRGAAAPIPPPQPTPPTPPSKDSLKEWVKKHLQSLGQLLARLAGKAAAAIPGIIGSIVSWLLTQLSKTAGWLAEHIWALAVLIGGMLIIAVRDWLQPVKRPKNK